MPKRSSKEEDSNLIAFRTLQEATQDNPADAGKNPAAVALGRLGGLKGGKARAESLSKARLKAIARKAAKARWAAQKKNKKTTIRLIPTFQKDRKSSKVLL